MNLSDPPSGVAEDIQLIVQLPVTGDVNHGYSSPEFRTACISCLLVHVFQVVLYALPGRLQCPSVLVMRWRDFQQPRQQKWILGDALNRNLFSENELLQFCVRRIKKSFKLTIKNELKFIRLKIVFSI